jgi:hypothetical protein
MLEAWVSAATVSARYAAFREAHCNQDVPCSAEASEDRPPKQKPKCGGGAALIPDGSSLQRAPSGFNASPSPPLGFVSVGCCSGRVPESVVDALLGPGFFFLDGGGTDIVHIYNMPNQAL